jgi:hypothetical protein
MSYGKVYWQVIPKSTIHKLSLSYVTSLCDVLSVSENMEFRHPFRVLRLYVRKAIANFSLLAFAEKIIMKVQETF